jgi:hypothetical protein
VNKFSLATLHYRVFEMKVNKVKEDREWSEVKDLLPNHSLQAVS